MSFWFVASASALSTVLPDAAGIGVAWNSPGFHDDAPSPPCDQMLSTGAQFSGGVGPT